MSSGKARKMAWTRVNRSLRTVNCTIYMGSTGEYDLEIETWLDANDGQIARGAWPFWDEVYALRYSLPLIISGLQED